MSTATEVHSAKVHPSNTTANHTLSGLHNLSNLSGEADKSEQDDTARQVLFLLQVKDTELRRLQADVAELRNEKHALQTEAKTLRTQVVAQTAHQKQEAAAQRDTTLMLENMQRSLDFSASEYDELVAEKRILLTKARSEVETHEALRNELQQERAARLMLEHRVDEAEQETLNHKELAANLTQMLDLQKEEARDRGIEEDNKTKQHSTIHASLTTQLEGKEAELIRLRALLDEASHAAEAKHSELQRAFQLSESAEQSATEARSQERLRGVEVGELRARVEALEAALQESQQQVKERTTELSAAQRSEEDATTQFRTQIQDVQERLSAIQADNAHLQAERGTLEAALYSAQQEACESVSYREEVDTLKQQLNDVTTLHASTELDLHKQNNERRAQDARLSEVTSMLQVLELEQEQLLNEASRVTLLEYEKKDLEKQATSLKAEVQYHESAAALNQQALLDLHEQMRAAQEEAQTRITALQKRLASAEREVQSKQHTIDASSNANDAAELALSSERDKTHLLHNQVAALEADLQDAQLLSERLRRALKQLKSDKLAATEEKDSLEVDMKHLSRQGVAHLHEHQQVVASLTSERDHLAAQLLDAEMLLEEREIDVAASKHSYDASVSANSEQGSRILRLEAQLKEMKQQRDSFANECALQTRRAAEKEAMLSQSTTQLEVATQERAEARRAVESLKRKVKLCEQKARLAEGKLEETERGEQSRKDEGAAAQRIRENRRRQEVMSEMRGEKAKLNKQVLDLTDALHRAEERSRALMGERSRLSKVNSELKLKTEHTDTTPPREWHDYVLAQWLEVVNFLVTYITSTLREIDSLRHDKGDLIHFAHLSDADDSALFSTANLSVEHYTQQLRHALGFKKGTTLPTVPTPKYLGGLRDGGRVCKNAADIIEALIKRVTRLESEKANLVAA